MTRTNLTPAVNDTEFLVAYTSSAGITDVERVSADDLSEFVIGKTVLSITPARRTITPTADELLSAIRSTYDFTMCFEQYEDGDVCEDREYLTLVSKLADAGVLGTFLGDDFFVRLVCDDENYITDVEIGFDMLFSNRPVLSYAIDADDFADQSREYAGELGSSMPGMNSLVGIALACIEFANNVFC